MKGRRLACRKQPGHPNDDQPCVYIAYQSFLCFSVTRTTYLPRQARYCSHGVSRVCAVSVAVAVAIAVAGTCSALLSLGGCCCCCCCTVHTTSRQTHPRQFGWCPRRAWLAGPDPFPSPSHAAGPPAPKGFSARRPRGNQG